MTDQGGWGGWSPQQRPDEPTPTEPTAEDAPATDAGDPVEPPRTYGAPTYGTPSYGAPTYGAPADQATPPTPQESYGRHGARDDEPPATPSYQQPTAPPSYPQPTAPPAYQQPTYPQPTYQQPTAPPTYQQPTAPPTYQQPTAPPAYQQPTQQQPTQQPTQQQPTYGGYAPPSQGQPQDQPTPAYGGYGGYQSGPPNQAGPSGGYGQPAPTKKRSGGKIALIIGLVVILVAGLGVGAWALFLRGGPAVTWQGKEVANPEGVLTEAQTDLGNLVSDAKGVKAEDTRCYYAVAKNPPKDTPKTDVGDTVYCGPALFVDGDTSKPYIPYGISAASDGDKVTLSINAKGTQDGATALPGDQKLVRPDGASAPDGAGDLKVPEPPPADANIFTTVDDVDVPAAPAGATMGALNGGVTLEKLGQIDRYGSGVDARSAPDGQKLIAFQIGDASGDGSSDGPTALGLKVSVDGAAGKDILSVKDIMVIAVPTDAKTVDLVTAANGVPQSLSLLDGKPGAGNLAVLARSNRFGAFTPPKGFTFTESGGGASAARPCTLTGDTAGLFYWADDEGTAHAAAPANAILETNLKYTFSTDSPAPFTGSSAGDSATFEPSHLTLTLPDGRKTQAKIIADRTVFEVPASFTEGTITIGGAFTNTNAITFTVAAPVSFKVLIPTS